MQVTSRSGECYFFFNHICGVRVEICYTIAFTNIIDYE